jgi:hypothetical protein
MLNKFPTLTKTGVILERVFGRGFTRGLTCMINVQGFVLNFSLDLCALQVKIQQQFEA